MGLGQSAQEDVQVCVVQMNGDEIAITAPDQPVYHLYRRLAADVTGLPAWRHQLCIDTRMLQPDSSLQQQGVRDGARLQLVTSKTCILTASSDGAKLWDPSSGKCLQTFEGQHKGDFSSAALSKDGATILTASSDATAKLWDASSGSCIRTFTGHDEDVLSAVFGVDGATVLTTSLDATAKLWDVSTGNCIQTFMGHDACILSAVFSPDGAMVLTASADDTAKLWDTSSGTCIQTYTDTGPILSASSLRMVLQS